MSDKRLPAIGGMTFEEIKQTNEHGAEYWSAHDLQTLLGYSQWRRFEQAIERAVISCQKSGNQPDHHFAGAGKMVGLGSGSQRSVGDYQLSRFACYLIAQNGDQRNPPAPRRAKRQVLTKSCKGFPFFLESHRWSPPFCQAISW